LDPRPVPYQGNATTTATTTTTAVAGKGNNNNSSSNSNGKDNALISCPQEVELSGSNPVHFQGFTNWLAFKDYLSNNYHRNTAKIRLCYAKRFAHVLLNKDVRNLLAVESEEMTLNIMKSSTAPSIFLGYADTWQAMCQRRHSLKWTRKDASLQSFQSSSQMI
jgi:hypothetical protein